MVKTGRRIVVTGSGSGIGRAVSGYLRDRGAVVLGVDIKGGDFLADVSAAGAAEAIAAEAAHMGGGAIDAAILCAGVSLPDDGAKAISINYFGVTRLMDALRPLLAGGEQPRAVALTSIATLFPIDDAIVDLCLAGDEAGAGVLGARNGNAAYGASKRALAKWIRRTAPQPQWAGAGILLNGLAPGTILTPMALPILADPEGRRMLAESVPLAVADYAPPEDIAPLIAFLASAENKFMVGQIPFVDGGSDVILRGDEPL